MLKCCLEHYYIHGVGVRCFLWVSNRYVPFLSFLFSVVWMSTLEMDTWGLQLLALPFQHAHPALIKQFTQYFYYRSAACAVSLTHMSESVPPHGFAVQTDCALCTYCAVHACNAVRAYQCGTCMQM